MRTTWKLGLAALLVAIPLSAQTPQSGERKPLSPPATTEATIGGQKIVVHYSAPSIRGRKIMGGLVPFDKVWRTGANAATTLVTQTDLRIGDLEVPRGTYTIYTIPREDEWTLIINRQTGQWGTQYDSAQDLGRVPMAVRAVDEPVETFLISIDTAGAGRGVLKLTWETTEASVPIRVAP
ncbi:MAG TPA: DUF2911 domain-containing protein [Thermoanaerobaculia bacterium]|nr:DUF2911 domain-containing protein [Thermoanaerobaculia bacterium]